MANGIASVRQPGLQTSQIASIGEGEITPGVADFMGAFKSGFITVDDINRRAGEAVVRPSELELRQKQAEQGILDTETIRPQQRELASKQLATSLDTSDIVAELARQQLEVSRRKLDAEAAGIPSVETITATTGAQGQVAQRTAAAVAGTPPERREALNETANRATEVEYTSLFGQLPASLPSKITPGAILTPETPEYYSELKAQVDLQKDVLGLKAAELKAVPGIKEAEAKAIVDTTAKAAAVIAGAPAAAAKSGAEIKNDMLKNQTLSNSILQEQALDNAKAFATKANPSNQDDIGLIYSTIKSFDPNAVREGELKLFQQGIGVPGQAEMLLNRLKGNTNAVLRPQERANILSLAHTLRESIFSSTLPELRTYFERAVASDAPLKQVFTDAQLKRLIGAPAGAAPVAGPATPQNIAAPGRMGTPGYPKKSQGGNIFEQQPAGNWISLGPAK